MHPVYVIGAGRTDFKRNFKKEGKGIREIILETAKITNARRVVPAQASGGVAVLVTARCRGCASLASCQKGLRRFQQTLREFSITL